MAQAQHYCVVRTNESEAAFEKALRNARDESTSLARAVGYWYETIKAARIKRISWDTIAAEMCKATGATGISGKAVCEAYKRASTARHKKLKTANLSDRFAAACELLAEAKGIDVRDAKNLINDRVPAVITKRQEVAAKKKAAKDATKKTVQEVSETMTEKEEPREKTLDVMYLQDQWKATHNNKNYPGWMKDGRLRISDAQRKWQDETHQELPKEIAAFAYVYQGD